MAVNTIDAKMLAKMFLAGAKNLESKKEWINELNVFPVPDGDTGTNMTLTIMSAAKDVAAMNANNDLGFQSGFFVMATRKRTDLRSRDVPVKRELKGKPPFGVRFQLFFSGATAAALRRSVLFRPLIIHRPRNVFSGAGG